jgi:WD40 repeat protein
MMKIGTDARMRCWRSDTGENMNINYPAMKQFCKASTEFCVSPNDEIVYRPNGIVIPQYNLENGELLNEFKGHFGTVHSCIFHPNREELYTAGMDNFILVWNIPKDDIEEDEIETNSDKDEWSDED